VAWQSGSPASPKPAGSPADRSRTRAIAIPEIVLASSLVSIFVLGKTPIGCGSILFSHIGFAIAFVAITVRARVQGLINLIGSFRASRRSNEAADSASAALRGVTAA